MRITDTRVDIDRLTTAELTYPERGATAGPLPPGYQHVNRRDRIGAGEAVFHRAVDALTTWQMHRAAGLTLLSAPPVAVRDALVVLRLGPPLIGPLVPCRVIYTVDEAQRCGFAYGTLPGHPECGEELFLVERDPSGDVHFVIRNFSRHATRLARLGGPLTTAVQRIAAERYLRALRQLSQ